MQVTDVLTQLAHQLDGSRRRQSLLARKTRCKTVWTCLEVQRFIKAQSIRGSEDATSTCERIGSQG